MPETDESFTSPESPFPDEQLDALRQFIRQEVRRALAEIAPVVTVQYAIPQDRARLATEVNRQLLQQARMQGVGRLASAAGVSYEEAEREIVREEGR